MTMLIKRKYLSDHFGIFKTKILHQFGLRFKTQFRICKTIFFYNLFIMEGIIKKKVIKYVFVYTNLTIVN